MYLRKFSLEMQSVSRGTLAIVHETRPALFSRTVRARQYSYRQSYHPARPSKENLLEGKCYGLHDDTPSAPIAGIWGRQGDAAAASCSAGVSGGGAFSVEITREMGKCTAAFASRFTYSCRFTCGSSANALSTLCCHHSRPCLMAHPASSAVWLAVVCRGLPVTNRTSTRNSMQY